jgi:hypothetical protein
MICFIYGSIDNGINSKDPHLDYINGLSSYLFGFTTSIFQLLIYRLGFPIPLKDEQKVFEQMKICKNYHLSIINYLIMEAMTRE